MIDRLGMLGVFGLLLLSMFQARADPRWPTNAWEAENLVVMVNVGEGCSGTGFLVGYDAQQVYAVTAAHILPENAKEVTVSTRIRIGPPPAREKTSRAKVLQRDASRTVDLASLAIDDQELLRVLKSGVRFDVLGDSGGLVTNDNVYATGCGEGVTWDRPARLDPILRRVTASDELFFQSDYVREGFSGAPLFHVLGRTSEMVGMVVGGAPRARAVSIDALLARLGSWHVPTQLTAVGTTFGCTYRVSTQDVALSSKARESVRVNVTTSPSCKWGVYFDESFWLSVFKPEGAPAAGSSEVVVWTQENNFCDGSNRDAVARIAGQTVRIDQDGTDLGQGCR